VAVEPVATKVAEVSAEATSEPAESAEATVEPAKPAEAEMGANPDEGAAAEKTEEGGITLPSWLLLLAGLLIGGVGAWAIFGQEPGTPNPEK
jgi:hypothetical protein